MKNWSEHPVVYHLYLLSFRDTSADGFGDIQGVIEKLDYLESLGVGAIWLSPVYDSPMADYGYDVSDYRRVNPLLGSMKDFETLISEAHRRGLKVMLDFIPNHTAATHPWFMASRSSKDDPKRDWYVWQDPAPDGSPPNNWLSNFGGPAWTLDEKTGQYYLHSFLPAQPDLNWRNPDVRAAMIEVMRFWLDRGVDGFRIDAFLHLMKDRLFRDDPPNPNFEPDMEPHHHNLHIYSQNRRSVIGIISELCEATAGRDIFMVGEAYLDTDLMLEYYGACASGAFAPFNFNLMSLPWFADDFREFIDDYDAALPAHAVPTYVFGNHDRSRVVTRLGRDRARVAAILLLTLRGTPFIYYGDELGMGDGYVPPERVRDPLEKQVPGRRLGRDPERVPMQWTGGRFAGFSSTEPWLPTDPLQAGANAEDESKDPRSFLALYRTLLRFRKDSPALCRGRYRSLDAGAHVFAFLREHENDRVLVMANFSSAPRVSELKNCVSKARVVCSTHDRAAGDETDPCALTLEPNEAIVLELRS